MPNTRPKSTALSPALAGFGVGEQPTLRRYSFERQEGETLREGAGAFVLSHDRKKLLVRAVQNWHIAPAGKATPGETRITAGDIQVRVDPRAEWRQMLREAWRFQRDFFYDPVMLGADWNGVWTRSEAFLPHLATRGDLRRVIQWMLSELAVGHSYGGGGDDLQESENVPGGLLGADYAVAHER